MPLSTYGGGGTIIECLLITAGSIAGTFAVFFGATGAPSFVIFGNYSYYGKGGGNGMFFGGAGILDK